MWPWARALLPYVMESLPRWLQGKITLITALITILFWAARSPQKPGWLCAAGVVLILVILHWSPGGPPG
jgi:hypothetical protein